MRSQNLVAARRRFPRNPIALSSKDPSILQVHSHQHLIREILLLGTAWHDIFLTVLDWSQVAFCGLYRLLCIDSAYTLFDSLGPRR